MRRRHFLAQAATALAAAACALLPGRKAAAQPVVEKGFAKWTDDLTLNGTPIAWVDKFEEARPAKKQSPWNQRWWNIRGEEPDDDVVVANTWVKMGIIINPDGTVKIITGD